MRKIILQERRKIFPFNEPARELRVLNKPLWLYHRDMFARYATEERELDSLAQVDSRRVETLVYRDNLFFDQFFQLPGNHRRCYRTNIALNINQKWSGNRH